MLETLGVILAISASIEVDRQATLGAPARAAETIEPVWSGDDRHDPERDVNPERAILGVDPEAARVDLPSGDE